MLVGGFDGCSRVFRGCFARVFRECFAGFTQGVSTSFAAVSQLFRAVSQRIRTVNPCREPTAARSLIQVLAHNAGRHTFLAISRLHLRFRR